MANYFVSDLHFSHPNIINWERNQFKTIEDHDIFLISKLRTWANKYSPDDTLYILGDWGDISYLYLMRDFNCRTVFIAGNHDRLEDKSKFEEVFDEVYWHPIYLSERIIVSHYPQAVYPYQLSIHGHLHGMIVNDPHYITCSANDINYNPITDRQIQSAFGRIDKMKIKFLWEPWADNLKLNNPLKKNELVCGPDGMIDVSASRLLQKQFREDSWNLIK